MAAQCIWVLLREEYSKRELFSCWVLFLCLVSILFPDIKLYSTFLTWKFKNLCLWFLILTSPGSLCGGSCHICCANCASEKLKNFQNYCFGKFVSCCSTSMLSRSKADKERLPSITAYHKMCVFHSCASHNHTLYNSSSGQRQTMGRWAEKCIL